MAIKYLVLMTFMKHKNEHWFVAILENRSILLWYMINNNNAFPTNRFLSKQ